MSIDKTFSGERVAMPGDGENPWQESNGLYADPGNLDPLAIHRFNLEAGAQPSHNNYADIDRLLQTMTHIAAGLHKNGLLDYPIALGAKHGNMCGASVHQGRYTAIEQMLDGDPTAIFGGSVMLNTNLNHMAVSTLLYHNIASGSKRFLNVACAPRIDQGGQEQIERQGGKLRVLTNQALGSLTTSSLDQSERFRHIRGGFLAQENYTYVPDMSSEEWIKTNGDCDDQLKKNLILGWAIGSTSTSNTVTIVNDGVLIGNGVGQQDRVSAAGLAAEKAGRAGHAIEGSVAYSDSFFPFPDGPQKLVDAGISAVFTYSGSRNDDTALEPFKDNGVRVFTVPNAKGRGFYGH